MNYTKYSPSVIREYLVYMETILGRSAKTVSEYYLDLRTFFRFILLSRNLVDKNTPFDEISIDQVDIKAAASVTRSEILDFLVFAANERPKHHKSLETSYGNSAKTRARKISANQPAPFWALICGDFLFYSFYIQQGDTFCSFLFESNHLKTSGLLKVGVQASCSVFS